MYLEGLPSYSTQIWSVIEHMSAEINLVPGQLWKVSSHLTNKAIKLISDSPREMGEKMKSRMTKSSLLTP
jgi:hypothetical protein